MSLTKVKILVQTITQQYGALSEGDILNTDAAFAKHLVEDCSAAEYVQAPKPAEPEPPPEKPAKAKK